MIKNNLKKYRFYLILLAILICVPFLKNAFEGKYNEVYDDFSQGWVKEYFATHISEQKSSFNFRPLFKKCFDKADTNIGWVKNKIKGWDNTNNREKGIIISIFVFLLSITLINFIGGIDFDLRGELIYSYFDYIPIILKRVLLFFIFLFGITFIYFIIVMVLNTTAPITYAIETGIKTPYDVWNDKKQYLNAFFVILIVLLFLKWMFIKKYGKVENKLTFKERIKKLNFLDKFFLILLLISTPFGIYYTIRMYQPPGYHFSDISPLWYTFYLSIFGFSFKLYLFYKEIKDEKFNINGNLIRQKLINLWKDKFSIFIICTTVLALSSITFLLILLYPFIIFEIRNNY